MRIKYTLAHKIASKIERDDRKLPNSDDLWLHWGVIEFIDSSSWNIPRKFNSSTDTEFLLTDN